MQSQCGQPDFWEALWESVRFSETIPAQIPPPPSPPFCSAHWGVGGAGRPENQLGPKASLIIFTARFERDELWICNFFLYSLISNLISCTGNCNAFCL